MAHTFTYIHIRTYRITHTEHIEGVGPSDVRREGCDHVTL